MTTRVSASPFSPFCRREWASWLDAMLGAVAGADERPGLELHVVRDGDIAVLNAAHLGCAGPTNILSFPDHEGAGPGGGEHLGALVLSADTLRRESVLYGQDLSRHARRLLAHGLAHLLGHDHGPAMDAVCAALEEAAEPEHSGQDGASAGLDAARRV